MPNPTISKTEEELNKKLGEIREHGTEDEYRSRALKVGLPFSDLAAAPIDPSAISLWPEEQARKAEAAIILKNGRSLTIALVDPDNETLKTALAELEQKGFTLAKIMVSPATMEKVLQRYAGLKKVDTFELGSVEIGEDELNALQSQINSVADLKNQINAVSVTKLLDILLAGALKIGASDIHFEPGADAMRLRYRLDGVLQDVTTVDKESYVKVLNRIKVLTRLKLNIHSAPQDGRFTIRQQNIDIEVRVSILPSEYGETIVMRLLDPRSIKGKLEDLGMRPDFLAMIREQLNKPTGALFTTGPTGSGKTTTLYAFINELNSPDEKIITIEDPIEYHISGISQTQVEPDRGYTFANGLRAIVRQDPDIILVGEVRDNETAEIALNAALTGHLVLSTLHTNDAAGTIPRLINLDVQPQIIAPAIRMAMAQRLVRRLCPECRSKKPLGAERLAKVSADLIPVSERFKIPKLTTETEISEPVGCAACNNSGYKGRVGVYEAFHITAEMEKLILSNPSISSVSELAAQQGMVTMRQDGYLKLLEGTTSFEEIERVIG